MILLFRIERRSFSDKESQQFTHYCRVVVQDFLPHLVNCFNALFPPQTVNELASCSPYALHCTSKAAMATKQQSTVHTSTGRRGVQLKLEFDLSKLIEPLRVMLPDLFANDVYIADSLTQQTALLHNDDMTSDDVTGRVGEVPPVADNEKDASHDVMLKSMGKTSVTNGDKHDPSESSEGEFTGDSKETSDMKESLTNNDLPTISTPLQQDI